MSLERCGTGRCEKIEFKSCPKIWVKKIALGCPISDRRGVGRHLGSKIKSGKLEQIDFFTSSRRSNPLEHSHRLRCYFVCPVHHPSIINRLRQTEDHWKSVVSTLQLKTQELREWGPIQRMIVR